MSEDAELLRRYALEHSEAAFAELIRRHIDLVYSAAVRLMNGDTHRAQDVTQQVFAEFARQAKRLMRHPAPVGWLYTTTRLSALRVIRTDQRRNAREQEANTMNELLRESTPEPDWTQLSPVLEDAMHELGEKDRHAVLLRFFQNKSLKEIGLALDLGENAARMRVDRALDKLRAALLRRGVAVTSTLAAVISANAVQLAPPSLSATLATTSIATGAGTFTLLKIMTATQLKLGISALIVAGAATALVLQHQRQNQVNDENQLLQQQLAQLKSENEGLSNRLASVGDSQKLAAEQLSELLKLRGETGLLKSQLSAAKSEAQMAARSLQVKPVQDTVTPQREAQMRRLTNAKSMAAAVMFGYDRGRADQFPTNWDQTAGYFDEWARRGLNPGDPMPDTAAEFMEMTNLFDLAYQGSMSNLYAATNFHDVIVVREKQPWQTTEGKWMKVYGFADGHSQIQHEPPEGFDAYEQNHIPMPAGQ